MNKLIYIFVLLLMLSNIVYGQVAVNETSPSTSAALYLEAQKIPSTNFGGFLMPVVTEVQQSAIPVSTSGSSDDGLMVYVSDSGTGKHCWEIYDGQDHIWRTISCLTKTCSGDILYEEDFNSYLEDTGVTGASSTNGSYPTNVTKWTLTSFQTFGSSTPSLPGTLENILDYALVQSGELVFRDTNGALRFESEQIDISGYNEIIISMEIRETGNLEYDATKHSDDFNCGDTLNDFVDIEYSVDGGNNYTEISSFSGNGNANHTIVNDLLGTLNFSANGISGTSLIFRIRVQNWAADEVFYIDNIVVKCN